MNLYSITLIIVSSSSYFLGQGQVIPKHIYVNDFQTGFMNLCPNSQCTPLSDSNEGIADSNLRKKTYIIPFNSSFSTMPLAQVYITNYHQINSTAIRIKIDVTQIFFVSFNVSVTVWNANIIQNLTIQWIATSNKNITIMSLDMSNLQTQTFVFPHNYKTIPALQFFTRSVGHYGNFQITQIHTLTNTTITVINRLNNAVLKIVALIVDQSDEGNQILNLENSNCTVSVSDQIKNYNFNLSLNTLPSISSPQILVGYQGLGFMNQQKFSFDISLQNQNLSFSVAVYPPPSSTNYIISYGCLTQLICENNSYLKNKICICNNGTQPNQQLQQCITCNINCLSCNGPMDNQCLTCVPSQYRTLINNSCMCLPQYFDGGLIQCQKCDPYCEMCSGSAFNQCLSCITQIDLVLQNYTCNCQIGYYKSDINLCLKCDSNCQQCSNLSTQCTTCGTNQNLQINICVCQNGYFMKQNDCQKCDLNCVSCVDLSTKCTVCDTGKILQNNICVCQANYFMVQNNCQSITYVCYIKECDLNCKSCLNFSSQCTACGLDQILIKQQCQCLPGYSLVVKQTQNYDQNCQPLLVQFKCDSTCLTCDGLGHSNCLTCDPCLYRVFDSSMCQCKKGYLEVNGKCVNNLSQNSQITKPESLPINCNQNQQQLFSECTVGFYFNYQQLNCQPCDSRCHSCNGSLLNLCTSCKFISIANECKLCTEVLGLYNAGGRCINLCGDGIIYKPYEECDDGNFNQTDGCSSQCLIVPILGNAYLSFLNDSQPFNSTRLAVIKFQQEYQENDFEEWNFVIPNYDPQQYELIYLFVENELQINVSFYQSTYGQSLIVTATEFSPLFNRNMQVIIPDYTFVSQNVAQVTQNVLSVSSIFYDLIFAIMLISILTGGFDMFFELLDLLQFLSYLKYFNVVYPYNVNAFFDYLSAFNFSQITNNIPFINNYSVTQFMNPYEQAATQTPDKLNQDGYISLFSYNFLGIFLGWICTLSAYLISVIVLYIFSKWNNIDQLNSYKGIKRYLYILRFTLSRYIVLTLKEFNGTFFFNGLLKTFIASEYALNFCLMLELNQLHLISGDTILVSSSWLAMLILVLKFVFIHHMVSHIKVNKSVQLRQIRIQSQIGSAVEGYKLEVIGAKYFGILDLVKIFFFMFFLVILYDNPFYQVAGVMFICLMKLLLVYSYQPYEDENSYWKTISREGLVFLATNLIFLFAIDDEIKFLNDDQKIIIGWFIIGICLVMILIQMLIDIIINFQFMYKQLVGLCRYIKRKMKKQKKSINRQKTINSNLMELKIVDPSSL